MLILSGYKASQMLLNKILARKKVFPPFFGCLLFACSLSLPSLASAQSLREKMQQQRSAEDERKVLCNALIADYQYEIDYSHGYFTERAYVLGNNVVHGTVYPNGKVKHCKIEPMAETETEWSRCTADIGGGFTRVKFKESWVVDDGKLYKYQMPIYSADNCDISRPREGKIDETIWAPVPRQVKPQSKIDNSEMQLSGAGAWPCCYYNGKEIGCVLSSNDGEGSLSFKWEDGVKETYWLVYEGDSGKFYEDVRGGVWEYWLGPQGNVRLTNPENGNEIFVPLRGCAD